MSKVLIDRQTVSRGSPIRVQRSGPYWLPAKTFATATRSMDEKYAREQDEGLRVVVRSKRG